MRLQNIINEQIRIENSLLLENICSDLLPQQRYIIEGIYAEFVPLIEATLDADQVKTLFGTVEKQSIAGGRSRTLTGATVDVAKQANEVINSVGRWLQNTTPVKAFDQKFEDLKASVSKKFPNVANQLTALGDLAKENPGKTAAIIGVMTSIASLAGTPAAGAAVGFVLRGTLDLLKGEKLSTAIGQGIKTAAYSWLAGKAFEMIGDVISSGVKAVTSQFSPKLMTVDLTYIAERTGMPFAYEEITAIGKPEDILKLEGIFNKAIDAYQSGNYAAAEAGFQQAAQLNDYMVSMDYFIDAGIGNILDQQQNIQEIQKGASELMRGLASAAQGAAAGATAYDKSGKAVDDQGKPVSDQDAGAAAAGKKKEESYYLQTRPLSEGQIYLLFDHIENYSKIEYIAEGPLDALKKGVGAVAKGASWLGKQATEKITSAKLFASWKLEGSPTDSEELAKFLRGQGVEDSVIDSSYEEMKLPAPSTKAPEEKPAGEKKINTAELGKYGYDAHSGMAFTSPEDRAEYYQIIGEKDPGQSSKTPTLNPGAEPWDAEKFKKEELPYVQAAKMVVKLPVGRQAALLQALLKVSKAAPDAASAKPAKPTATA